MRVQCPCCREKFDIPIRAVLAEAERIKNFPKKIPAPVVAAAPNGNLLSPQELEEKRRREDLGGEFPPESGKAG